MRMESFYFKMKSSFDVQPHIQFLKSRQIKLAALSPHDSSIDALEAFQSAFAESYRLLRVGRAFNFRNYSTVGWVSHKKDFTCPK